MAPRPFLQIDDSVRDRGTDLRRALLLALLGWVGLSAGARGELLPCCQTIEEAPSCVLPWTAGKAACESGGGTLVQANRCRAGAFCDVVHEVPVDVDAMTGEIVLTDGLERETLTFDGSRMRGTMTIRSDPTCFTPPRAGTDCTIETELVALDLAGSTELGEVVFREDPRIFNLGEIGPVTASPEGCYGPAVASFGLHFNLDLPALGLELRDVPFTGPRLEGTLEVGGAECSTLRGALALADRVLLTPDVTFPPSLEPSAAASGTPSDPTAMGAPQKFFSGQLSTLVLAFPAERAAILGVPGVSWGGLALLALLLGVAALAVLARR